MKQHSLSLLQERIAGSESAQLAESVAATQGELEEARAAAIAAQQKKQDMHKAAQVSSSSLNSSKNFTPQSLLYADGCIGADGIWSQTAKTNHPALKHCPSHICSASSGMSVFVIASQQGSYTKDCNVAPSIARPSTL